MRRFRLRLALAGLAALLLMPTTLAAPAAANHDNDFGHWNQPPLVVTKAGFAWDSVIQDAAYYWQDVAFFRGYYPPLPHREGSSECDPEIGRITVCVVPPGNFWLGGGLGKIWPTHYQDGSNHISTMVIYIDDSLTGALRQIVMRHEFGHALGLGHHDRAGANHPVSCTVMNDGGCGMTPYANGIDHQSVWAWQPYIYSWQWTWHNQH